MTILRTAVLRVLLLSVFSASVLTVNAGGILRVKPVEETGKLKAVVSFTNFNEKNVIISIEDLDRESIFYQESLGNVVDFAKVFDLSFLEDGSYVIAVRAGNEVLSQRVSIVDSKLTVEDSKILLEPVFRLKNNVLLVYFNRGSEGFYNVGFYDNSGMFFSDELESSTGVKKYSLENLPAGDYTVSVNGKTAEFSYDFEKD